MIKLFTASWCGQCKQVKEIIDSSDYDYTTVSLDSQEGGIEATKYGVRGLPTLIKLEGDEVVDTFVYSIPLKVGDLHEFFK